MARGKYRGPLSREQASKAWKLGREKSGKRRQLLLSNGKNHGVKLVQSKQASTGWHYADKAGKLRDLPWPAPCCAHGLGVVGIMLRRGEDDGVWGTRLLALFGGDVRGKAGVPPFSTGSAVVSCSSPPRSNFILAHGGP